MNKRNLLLVLAVIAAAVWWLARPVTLGQREAPNLRSNPANGERIFLIAGCGSCHGDDSGREFNPLRLSGGLELASPYGTFRAPNISPDPVWGIGDWSLQDFLNAMRMGVSPEGKHYYPSFPYTSYNRMTDQDIADLKGYIDTLEKVDRQVAGHDLGLPYRARWTLGLWKRLFLDDGDRVEVDLSDPLAARGRYLVEGPGHCGECHTPRNFLGALDGDRWLAGAPNADGEGKSPNITPHADGIGDWSATDIAYYLQTGVDPDFDLVGGHMVRVQENLAQLPESEREAIAAYLKAVSPQPGSGR